VLYESLLPIPRGLTHPGDNAGWYLPDPIPTTKIENEDHNSTKSDVRYCQNHPILAQARLERRPASPQQGIPPPRERIFPEIRGIFAEMQIPGMENVVTNKQENQKQKANTQSMMSFAAISEYCLSAFLENEPDLYSVADLKVRYK
jgi:hypothetical protein